jgi:hypothetical protein
MLMKNSKMFRIFVAEKMDNRMKKLPVVTLSIILYATLLSGCTMTLPVISQSAFDRALDSVAGELKANGFEFVHKDRDKHYEPNAIDRSPKQYASNNRGVDVEDYYSRNQFYRTGFEGNDYTYIDTYHFGNEEGDTVSFTLSYQTRFDPSQKLFFVTEVRVGDCQASTPALEERFCGTGGPVRILDSLKADTVATL